MQLFMNLFGFIKNSFIHNRYFSKINLGKLKNISFATLLFVIIILNSGYTITYLTGDTFIKTLISVISFLILLIIYIFTVDFSELKQKITSRQIPVSFILVILFGISALITMFVSNEANNIVPYITFGIMILSSYLFARIFSFKTFIHYYQNIIFIIAILAIMLDLFTLISGVSYSPLNQFVSQKGATYENFFFINFQEHSTRRIQGPFWEPGLFASFLLLGLVFEFLFFKKIRIPYVVVYLLAILLTFSTFGYLMLIFIIIVFIYKKVNNFRIFSISLIALSIIIILFFVLAQKIIPLLADAFPLVFTKMLDPRGNIVLLDASRLNCPICNIQIWLRNPIFGNGIANANTIYHELFPNFAQTSTNTFLLAQFGIPGLLFTIFFIVGILKIKGIDMVERVMLCLMYIVILNKEPHTGIWFDWIFMFICIKEFVDHDKKSLVFDTASNNSIIHSFKKEDDASIVKTNLVVCYLIKGAALIIGFFSYPIYQRYFSNNDALGVWLTVLSLMNIALTFDFGLGNGLKNKLIKAIVDKDVSKQKSLISATYVSTGLISLIILAIITPIIFAVDLNSFLGVSANVIQPIVLKISSFLVILSICIELTLRNVNSLLQAKQKQFLSSSFGLLSTILLMIFALTFKSNDANTLLIAISVAYILTINIPLLLGTIFSFYRYYKGINISFKCVNKESINSVLTLGIGFFIIQLLLLATTGLNETIISNIFGSSATVFFTDYNKPFMVIYSLFTIISLPYWSIIAKEKEEGKYELIKIQFKKCLIFVAVFMFFCLLLSIIFKPFINLWLGENAIDVNPIIVVAYNILIFELILMCCLTVVTNGLSIIKEQIIYFGIAAIIKIVLCILLKVIDMPNKDWSYVVYINIIALIPLVVGLSITVLRTFKKFGKVEQKNEN